MKELKKNYAIVIVLTICLIAFSCNKNSQTRAFYPPVDEYINITLPSHNTLAVAGGWSYINGGLKGIIVYRQSNNEFIAFDRNCTHNEANSCGKVSVNQDNVKVECSCDDSEFSIFDGSVINGPAELPLKGYYTSFNSSNNTLRVYN